MNTSPAATRPTTRLFAEHCEQYRDARTPLDRWHYAAERRDFYAVCIARHAIAGRDVSAADVYGFRLFDRLGTLHHLAYLRAEHHAESVNA